MTTAGTHVRHRIRRQLGLAVIVTALLTATACGGDVTSTAADRPSTASSTALPPTQPIHSPTSTVPTPTSPTTPPITQPTMTAPSAPDASTSADERPTATLDELVHVAGPRVHVRCSGSGTSTVVLISGYETGSVAWSAVEPTIAERTRVCTYDRPGTGTSDPAREFATFNTQARDLRDLLTAIGEPGPYVVVGHSFGGAQAVAFASAFPDEVAALVLVDASPITWPDALCGVTDDGSEAATMLRNLCGGWSEPTGNAEHLDVVAAFADAATITSLDSLPMAVITAVDRQLPSGLATGEIVRLTNVWNQGQQHWSQLSTRSHVVPVDDTSHDIQLDHPDVVIDEIVHLLP
jgi:pimeloyl-ACP methyl ester carboxylesterase